MAYRLICEYCDERKLPTFSEDFKREEMLCVYCPKNEEMEASCLFKGKPCCTNCKTCHKSLTKSPKGSIRSERLDVPQRGFAPERRATLTRNSFEDTNSPFISPNSMTGAHEYAYKIEQTLSRALHSRTSSQVNTEFLKAHTFLTKYVNNCFNEITPLYDSHVDGYNSITFHQKCDDSKGGMIIIISFGALYEIAAFTWKGIRKGCVESTDVQVGGAIIKDNEFEFVNFYDQFVINEPEGIRFSRKSDLYINFDDISRSVCNFDKKLANSPNWASTIQEISVYKLQV